jgi:hypothetical protein
MYRGSGVLALCQRALRRIHESFIHKSGIWNGQWCEIFSKAGNLKPALFSHFVWTVKSTDFQMEPVLVLSQGFVERHWKLRLFYKCLQYVIRNYVKIKYYVLYILKHTLIALARSGNIFFMKLLCNKHGILTFQSTNLPYRYMTLC